MKESDLNFGAKINIFIENTKTNFLQNFAFQFWKTFQQIIIPLNIGNKILQ